MRAAGVPPDARAIVLVEGISDRNALQALAARRGRDLATEGVRIVPIGGAQAIGRVLPTLPPDARVAGLCDAGEARYFRRALDDAAVFVCEPDLEAELIRAAGPARVLELLAEHGDLRAFRTLQKQSAWDGRPLDAQLRRFMGSGGRRKTRYPPVLVAALADDAIPPALDGVLTATQPA